MKNCKTLAFVLLLFLTLVPSLGWAQEPAPEARKVMDKVDPQYPALAHTMNIQGSVRLEVVVAPNGTVRSVEVKGGHPLLVPPAQLAVKRWRWQPASHETHEIIEFRFNH